jgi:hypothetical protein
LKEVRTHCARTDPSGRGQRAPATLVCVIVLLPGPAAYADATPHTRTVCTSGSATREIVVWVGNSHSPAECHVDYIKDGATSQLWSAHQDESFCARNAEQLKRRLTGAGFACMAVDTVGRAQTILPGGILLRPVQKEDLQQVRSLCPLAQWQDGVFTCSRSEWAPWARMQESAEIPPGERAPFQAFVSQQDFLEKPTDGVLIFPDLSSHLIFEGFSRRTGRAAAWLIDPHKRTVDLIWLNGGAPVYIGPDADLLRSNGLDTDSFKTQSRPAPAR